MNIFPQLWQRIFLYSMLLVIVTFCLGRLFVSADMQNKMREISVRMTGDISHQINNHPLQTVKVVLEVLSRGENKLWIEDDQGTVLAGVRPENNGSGALKHGFEQSGTYDGMTLWIPGEGQTRALVEAPVIVEGKPAVFFSYHVPPKGPPVRLLVYHSVFAILCVAGVLALWMSIRISRPLRRLRNEIISTKGSGIVHKVTVKGNDEIAEVAMAINEQADRLQKYIRGMRELMVNISHEMRSPLARISLSAAMIDGGLQVARDCLERERTGHEKDTGDESKLAMAEKHLAALQSELGHMDKLIGTIMQANRLELQDKSSLTDLVSLSGVCEETVQRYHETFSQAGLVTISSIEPGLYLFGDGTLLVQMLSNLLDNAVKYTTPGAGEIRIQLTRRRDAHAFLTVENASAPLAPDVLEKIFDPFYRADQKTGTGVGLGLSLVRKIANLHGGDVMAVSTDLGVCLCVQLPLATENEPLVVVVEE